MRFSYRDTSKLDTTYLPLKLVSVPKWHIVHHHNNADFRSCNSSHKLYVYQQ